MKPTLNSSIDTGGRRTRINLELELLSTSVRFCATVLADAPLLYAHTVPFNSEGKKDTRIAESDPLCHELRIWQDFDPGGCDVISSELYRFDVGYKSEVLANMSSKNVDVRTMV